MQRHLSKLALATTLTLGAVTAQAADQFISLTVGESSSNIRKSTALNSNMGNPNYDKAINDRSTFGMRSGRVTDDHRYYFSSEATSNDKDRSLRLRQWNLLGSYDMFLPVGENGTKLFGGGSLGLVKLYHDGKGLKRDTNVGYAAGLQAGILQDITSNTSVEAGYRYLRTNASTEVVQNGGKKLGSLDLRSSGQLYLGASYKF